LHALDAPPFPLEYRCATMHDPATIREGKEQPVHMVNAHLDMINKINALERYFTSVNVTQANQAEVARGSRLTRFGSSPILSDNPFPIANCNAGPPGFVDNLMDGYSDPNEGMINISME
jgi:hypothetical protein